MSTSIDMSKIASKEQKKNQLVFGSMKMTALMTHKWTYSNSTAEANNALSKIGNHGYHAVLLNSPDRGVKPFSRSRDACTKVRI